MTKRQEPLEELDLDRGIQKAEEAIARYWEQILNSNDTTSYLAEQWERLMEWVDEQSLDSSNIAVWIR